MIDIIDRLIKSITMVITEHLFKNIVKSSMKFERY